MSAPCTGMHLESKRRLDKSYDVSFVPSRLLENRNSSFIQDDYIFTVSIQNTYGLAKGNPGLATCVVFTF